MKTKVKEILNKSIKLLLLFYFFFRMNALFLKELLQKREIGIEDISLFTG